MTEWNLNELQDHEITRLRAELKKAKIKIADLRGIVKVLKGEILNFLRKENAELLALVESKNETITKLEKKLTELKRKKV